MPISSMRSSRTWVCSNSSSGESDRSRGEEENWETAETGANGGGIEGDEGLKPDFDVTPAAESGGIFFWKWYMKGTRKSRGVGSMWVHGTAGKKKERN
jgi:hypothetical protein